jgi:hypothetical protein
MLLISPISTNNSKIINKNQNENLISSIDDYHDEEKRRHLAQQHRIEYNTLQQKRER